MRQTFSLRALFFVLFGLCGVFALLYWMQRPNSSDDYLFRATRYYNSAQYELALNDLNAAASFGVDYQILQMRALVYLMLEKHDQAATDIEEAIVWAPTDDPQPLWLGSVIRTETGDLSRSLQLLDQAVDQKPTDAFFLASRAYVLTQLDKLNAAVDDYNKAIEFAPHEGEFYFQRAATYKRLDNVDMSNRDLNRAIHLDRDLADRDINAPGNPALRWRAGKGPVAVAR